MVGRATVDSAALSADVITSPRHFVPPEVAEFPPPELLGEWGRIPWLPSDRQSLDRCEKPPTYVEAEGCLGGHVLRDSEVVGVVEHSAEVLWRAGRIRMSVVPFKKSENEGGEARHADSSTEGLTICDRNDRPYPPNSQRSCPPVRSKAIVNSSRTIKPMIRLRMTRRTATNLQ
jgi:hypothetical protein